MLCISFILYQYPAQSQATHGLNYKYYEGAWTTLPNFDTLTPVKSGISANIDLSIRNTGTDDNFAILWQGFINITSPGNYRFETMSDDGSKLYFNNIYSFSTTATVNNDGTHDANLAKTGDVYVSSVGMYPITITFFEATLDQVLNVYWTGPGISRQLIPDSVFFTSGSQGWSLTGNASTTTSNFIGTTDNQPVLFKTNDIERLRILPNGNFGIGITDPQVKLAVNGSIKAKKLIITSAPGADYVFDKLYKLPSLKAVEQYINKNHHLPDVPSATEVESNGIELGDHLAILLQKIEELTLYVIQHDKKLASHHDQLKYLLSK